MKKFLATTILLATLTISTTTQAALALGLTGNPLILAPMVPSVVGLAMGGGSSFSDAVKAFGVIYLGFFLLNEEGTVSVIAEEDSVNSLVAEGLTTYEANLLIENKEEINAAVNAVISSLNDKSTTEEVAVKWEAQKEFIGGEKVLKAYNKLGAVRVQK